MTRMAKINLNIRKDKPTINDPIILQQGEKDLIIEAVIDNSEYAEVIQNATFQATKPDGTHILNDPANISGNTISYPIPKQLTDTAGKIIDANFYINHDVNTVPFEIDITPGIEVDANPADYIPGFDLINKYMSEWSLKYAGMFKQMTDMVDGLDMPIEFKTMMDKYLDTIKQSYQPTIDNLINLAQIEIAKMAQQEQDLNDQSVLTDKALEDIKVKTNSISIFLETVQNDILSSNTEFTKQQKSVITDAMHTNEVELQKNMMSVSEQANNQLLSIKAQSKQTMDQLTADSKNYLDKIKSETTDDLNNMHKTLDNQNTTISDHDIRIKANMANFDNYDTKSEIETMFAKNSESSNKYTDSKADALSTEVSQKTDQSDFDALKDTFLEKFVSISDDDYQALVAAKNNDPSKIYLTPEE